MLDPQSFYDAFEIQILVSKFKMSVRSTNIIEPEDKDDLWSNREPWTVMINISSSKKMVEDFGSEISATATKAKGVKPERVSKIWSISVETAKRIIV